MPQDDLYTHAVADYGAALDRLARSYEADPEKRRDLAQEIHFALWRSLAGFRRQCSLRTWVYRVAHNVAASHVLKQKRRVFVPLEDFDQPFASAGDDSSIDRQRTLERLHALIQQLTPLDREVILLYLEELDAAAIGEVTGMSPGAVATKIHRIKRILAERFKGGSS